MKSRDEEREEQRRYEGDVFYDVWRSGGNPDRVDYDRVRDYYYDGISSEAAANAELRRQRPAPPSDEEMFDESSAEDSQYCLCDLEPTEEELASMTCAHCGKEISP